MLHEFTWRRDQNWIGKDLGYRKKLDFVPARPEDVPELMQGLLALASRFRNGARRGMPEAMRAAVALPERGPIAGRVMAVGFVIALVDGAGRRLSDGNTHLLWRSCPS